MSQIYSHAFAIFNQFYASGCDPETWSKSPVDIVNYFCRSMCAGFEEFRLCDNTQWKAKKLASVKYPDWCRDYRNSKKLKRDESGGRGLNKYHETASDTSTDIPQPKGKARCLSSAPASPKIQAGSRHKKIKLGIDTSTPMLVTLPAAAVSPTPVMGTTSSVPPMSPSPSAMLPVLATAAYTPNSATEPISHANFTINSPIASSPAALPTAPMTALLPIAATRPSSTTSSTSNVGSSSESGQKSKEHVSIHKAIDLLAGFAVGSTVAPPLASNFTTSAPTAKGIKKQSKRDDPQTIEDNDVISARNIYALHILQSNHPTRKQFTELWRNIINVKANAPDKLKWFAKERDYKAKFGREGRMKDVRDLLQS
ncbi:hypothetical protein GGU11DRAFT_750687 [Lentinula aff. detonsa]|nr:hypothetical protein GGU11DRAFT_750687 [Lentinula aff. detonsa]